jgi:aminoglycoside phosphotransferase (APT) family kinase protein
MAWAWAADTLDKLSGFLSERGILDGELSATRIGDGHSNLTFLVSDGTRQVIVRRPPPPPTPPGAHDMLREARLLTALGGTAVPVATVLATAQPGEVLDVGFYVMTFAPGPVITTTTPVPFDNPRSRREIGYALLDRLADLHAVDWRVAGLSDLGKPAGFNARHLSRMRALVADANGQLPGQFAALDAWLTRHVPPESGAAIVHNDYRIGNVIVAPEQPARILAVLDWELATIGDPLFDLGYFLVSVPVPGEPLTPTGAMGTALLEDGFPSREDLAERYASRTGRDIAGLTWYVVLALWKLAVLYEYGRRRAVDPYYADQRLVQSFLDAAHRTAGI